MRSTRPQQHRFRRVALLWEKDFRQFAIFQYANQRLFALMHKQCSHRFSKGVSSPVFIPTQQAVADNQRIRGVFQPAEGAKRT